MAGPKPKLDLAREHLTRVQAAWDASTDWADLSIYGLYCLESAIEAAAIHAKLRTSRKHWEKAEIAGDLHKKYGLPDVEDSVNDLNESRKAAAYGDVPAPHLDAEDVAREIERYVEAVEKFVQSPV
jgi:hypothetical protein